MFLHGKIDVKIFLMFNVAENTGSVNISDLNVSAAVQIYACVTKIISCLINKLLILKKKDIESRQIIRQD